MRLKIIDRGGAEHEVEAAAKGSLMEALRELEYGVAAICGGTCSCATCHVYIAPEWLTRLPRRISDERELIQELQHRQQTSRLSCQVRLAQDLDGMQVTLAPEE